MTDEEIAVKLTVLEQEAKSAKHRLDDLEVQNQAIQNLPYPSRNSPSI